MAARRTSIVSLLLALALPVAGCAGLDELGQTKKTPLAGDRKALFPQGVPGVEFGAPPQQPSNSNIPITANLGSGRSDENAVQPTEENREGGTKQAQQKQPPADVKTGSRMQLRGQKLRADEQARAAALRAQEDRTAAKEEQAARTASRSKKKGEPEDPWSEAR